MHAFISYAFGDEAEHANLVDALAHAGVRQLNVSALPGLPLAEELRRHALSCGVCIFLCTTRSLASGWCQAELGAFWGMGKPVIVCIADPAIDPATLPPQFKGLTWTKRYSDAARAAARLAADYQSSNAHDAIIGKRLFQHGDYYPIDLAPVTHLPSINADRFGRALAYLTSAVDDRLAATDLVYLWLDNARHRPEDFPDANLPALHDLVDKYDLGWFVKGFLAEQNRVFHNYIRLVDDIGRTLQGVHFEVLLHDVRNPIRSIVAARNTEELSGRKVGDPSTRFVVQYVRDQGRELLEGVKDGSKVAYLKQFTTTKQVKATTTPLFDDRYGLVGILCVNIDVEAVERLSASARKAFFQNYARHSGTTPAFERADWPPWR